MVKEYYGTKPLVSEKTFEKIWPIIIGLYAIFVWFCSQKLIIEDGTPWNSKFGIDFFIKTYCRSISLISAFVVFTGCMVFIIALKNLKYKKRIEILEEKLKNIENMDSAKINK